MAVKIKICGVTDPANARTVVELGADSLGLNFYRASPRFVEVEQAREIAAAVEGRVPLVGVFVNHPIAEVEEIAERVGLDFLQFSGDESPEVVGLHAARAIKVFRTGRAPGPEVLAAYGDLWGVLLDAPHGSLYGGTGTAWDYGAIAPGPFFGGSRGRSRLFLAGGIGPDNARRAVSSVRPFAIDVCSRVESAPGIKDPELVLRLMEEARNGEIPTPS
ncbi:MAG TPA: phosphoribosylanthranilate isomerase [Thermoanaerobaculia bacterium]|nr:phosphoribosylanthranilate isomerase [Thermoanaerobaculia bacterium]